MNAPPSLDHEVVRCDGSRETYTDVWVLGKLDECPCRSYAEGCECSEECCPTESLTWINEAIVPELHVRLEPRSKVDQLARGWKCLYCHESAPGLEQIYNAKTLDLIVNAPSPFVAAVRRAR